MQQKPNLVVLNTEALTMDASQPQAQAVAVAEERILAVGSDEEIKGLAGPDTEVIDGQGLTLLPGFIDSTYICYRWPGPHRNWIAGPTKPHRSLQ